MTTKSTTDCFRRPHLLCGVPGLLTVRHRAPDARTFTQQEWVSEPRKPHGPRCASSTLIVSVRFDDECRNGHNSFGVTADLIEGGAVVACGMLHEEVADTFPELAHLIRWHGTSTDGPMHYVANTVYHASDKDSRGFRKGEPSRFDKVAYIGDSPVAYTLKDGAYLRTVQQLYDDGYRNFSVLAVPYPAKPGDTVTYPDYYTLPPASPLPQSRPFLHRDTAEQWAQALNAGMVRFGEMVTGYGEGKARDLDAARSCAVWPEATDEQLMLPPQELRKLLEDRLPSLIAAVRADVEAAGLLWESSTAVEPA